MDYSILLMGKIYLLDINPFDEWYKIKISLPIPLMNGYGDLISHYFSVSIVCTWVTPITVYIELSAVFILISDYGSFYTTFKRYYLKILTNAENARLI